MSNFTPITPAANGTEIFVDAPVPAVLHRTPKDLCGYAAGPIQIDNAEGPANENGRTAEALLFDQLPEVIREAVDEWAAFLRTKPWRIRRELMTTFAKIFAEQFREHAPAMSDEEFEGMKEIGYTCLLERLDDGDCIANVHQARLYLDSVHDRHRVQAQLFLRIYRPRGVEAAATGLPN
jgi:hypothetical protein